MSDNSPAIYGIPQTVSLPVGDIGIGSYIINDYLITVADSEDGNGYLLTIKKGSQIQEIHLTELKQEAIDAAISLALTEAKESGEFDGNGIERAVLNSDYTLTLYFTDGTSVTTTSIRGETGNGIQSVVINPDYTLTITFTDGDIYTTGSIRGLTGNGISEVVLNSDYTLTIRYTDGNSYTTTSIRGAKGDTGVSISGIIFNSDYTLTIECSDGTSYTTESIRGDKGETGTGISSARLNDDFTLTLNFDDGNSYTTRSIRGEKGAKGDKGDPGESFEIHACTSTEYDYDTRIPTIENPRANCLYLVPSSDAITTDLFVEWVYIYGRWEKFGSAEINLDAYAKKTEVAAKLDKPLRDGLSGQILVSNGSGGQTWNDLPVPDWNASNGSTGFIRNKPDLKAGTGTDSVVNRHSLVSGSHSMAVGTNNAASGSDNFVTGNGNNAKGSGSILSGDHNTAELRGSNSVVSGTNNLVSSSNNLVSGTINSVGGNNSVVGGSNNVVSGSCSLAVGDNNTASGTYSTVEGSHTTATMNAAHAEGTNTTASGDSSHAEGKATTASGSRSHAEGSATTASGTNSHAEGGQTESAAYYSHAEGYGTSATGSAAHAEGNTTVASGINSHAEGTNTLASGINSHAEGQFSIANHKSQHVFGENNIEDPSTATVSARGNYVEIVGNGSSSNDRSNARTLDWNGNEWIAGNFKIGGISYDDPEAVEVATKNDIVTPDWEAADGEDGYITNKPLIKKGTGSNSIITGTVEINQASGPMSHAEGYSTTASGNYSHAEGNQTTASGIGAHAEGYLSTASGKYSSTEGSHTIANHRSQHVFGECNLEDPSEAGATVRGNYVEIVGNGANGNARSNARTLDWSGNEWIAGNLKVGGTGYDDVNAKEVETSVLASAPLSEPASIITIENGKEGMPVKELTFDIKPIQDLHGYDSPWSAGSGKNLLPNMLETTTSNGVTATVNSDGSVTLNGTATASTIFNICTEEIVFSEVTDYILNGGADGGGASTYRLYGEYYNYSQEIWLGTARTASVDGTTLTTDKFRNVRIQVFNGAVINNVTFYPMIRKATETDATYAPYSNICPITGWTGAEIVRTGKNLFDYSERTSNHYLDTVTGEPVAQNGYYITPFIKVLANAPVRIPNSGSARRWFYDENKIAKTYLNNSSGQVFTPTEDGYIRVTVSGTNSNASQCQIEYGSEATEYEPYTGITIPITFPTEVGTVYGGHVEIKDGEAKLVVTHGQIASYNSETLPGEWISDRDVYAEGTTPAVGAQVVYELATPIIYTLDPVTLTTIQGLNHIWTNTGDIENFTYITNPGVYELIAGTVKSKEDVKDVKVNGTSIVNDGVANVPIGGNSTLGVVKGSDSIGMLSNGAIGIIPASVAQLKALQDNKQAITSGRLHNGVFYGLAKVAGDTTQASSSNPAGTYTDSAKASIKAMLGVGGETQKVTVSGTAPVIVANQNTRYVCGEVLSLDFTPSAEGICDVIFTSGSTVTVLTIPNAVIFPEWFDPTTLEANKTYEINITDGVYGAVMVW